MFADESLHISMTDGMARVRYGTIRYTVHSTRYMVCGTRYTAQGTRYNSLCILLVCVYMYICIYSSVSISSSVISNGIISIIISSSNNVFVM